MFRNLCAALFLALACAGPSNAQQSLDLRNVDLEGFVRIVAEESNRTFVLDPSVNGQVNVVGPSNVSPAALYEIFLNVLELNGLTIVEGREADRIVPISSASTLSAQKRTPSPPGGFETRVIRLRSADPNDVASVIRPLLPDNAVLSVVESSQSLIISDRAENFPRIEAVVSRLDSQNQTVEAMQVRNGNAPEMLQTILSLNIAPVGATVSADAGANTIVVAGPAPFRDRVRQLVRELDTPQRTLFTRVVRLTYADATQLADVISRSFGAAAADGEGAQKAEPVTVVADTQSNALIVTAPADRIASIVQATQALDRRPDQVLIEALIFELSVQTFSDLSVQFGAVLNDAIAGGVQFSLDGRQTLSGVLSAASSGKTPDPGAGGFIAGQRDTGDSRIAGFLTALNRSSTTRVLSTPSILTLDNQEAEIVVAQNVPFVTGSFSTVGDSAVPTQPFQTIERQDVGLTLRVVPQITVDDTVRMSISQEVSNLTNASSDAGGEITAKRSIRTNVIVRDSAVIMLGGLLEDGNGSVGQHVPGIANLPIIGNLFRGRAANADQRVLLVMLRPRIVSTDAEASALSAQAARDARTASNLIQPLDDGRFPRIPDGRLPFDGADLDQPFDALLVDNVARERMFPPLPSPLRFGEGGLE